MINYQRLLDVLHLAYCTWEDLEEAGFTPETATADALKFKRASQTKFCTTDETSWRLSLLKYVANYEKLCRRAFKAYVLDTSHTSIICGGYYSIDSREEREDILQMLYAYKAQK